MSLSSQESKIVLALKSAVRPSELFQVIRQAVELSMKGSDKKTIEDVGIQLTASISDYLLHKIESVEKLEG